MKRTIFMTALIGCLLSAGMALGQDTGRPMLCPKPSYETIDLSTPTPINADFRPDMLAIARAGLNDAAPNKFFLHTFQWKPPQCCQILGATLTITLRANQAGTSAAGSDAGNDSMGVMSNGVAFPGLNGAVYTAFPVAINQPTTRVYVMSAAALAAMNADNRLSFYVQDDTRVLSAKLQINRCCVK
ncbi:hypothetical protein [Phenylobacterium sp.]|jgi:hypothetical protein|uniref:hypothetical protein n=1 Tax=Phenylobacterium sp. TaxID=1871053 RepID=UPI00271F3F23|nr:hypothetical protein [Phenylobacterium sp.]MDO8802620.1 hypothetical protein [Phenylobacterium sp.]